MISQLFSVNTLFSMWWGRRVCVCMCLVKSMALPRSDKVFLGVSSSIDHSTCPKWEIDFLRFPCTPSVRLIRNHLAAHLYEIYLDIEDIVWIVLFWISRCHLCLSPSSKNTLLIVFAPCPLSITFPPSPSQTELAVSPLPLAASWGCICFWMLTQRYKSRVWVPRVPSPSPSVPLFYSFALLSHHDSAPH